MTSRKTDRVTDKSNNVVKKRDRDIRTITTKKISVDELIELTRDDGSGAIVLFLGTVRDNNNSSDGGSGRVTAMYYEAYIEMAGKQIEGIIEETRQKWPIKNIEIVHRIGKLYVGDISVAVSVSSVHREEAFEACRYAIDRIKNSLPIWKKEFLIDGSQVWVEGQKVETVW
ncbi:MAG TPA: molybdenum cofactor biosynthesis protein MoaE [Nitrososphaera sp.]|nr:molybdenum cofactor biosynthesis protein MoaE [Nitrososphaera sp.]